MRGATRPSFLFLLSEKGSELSRSEMMEALTSEGYAYPAASDWCCVHNFHAESRPRILSLPPGFGPIFRSDMEFFIEQARCRLRSIFASEDYRLEADRLRTSFDRQEQDVAQPIYQTLAKAGSGEEDEEQGIGSRQTERDPRKATPYTAAGDTPCIPFCRTARADEQLARDKIRLLKKRCSEELDSLTANKARETIAPLLLALKNKYRKNSRILVYLEEVGEDILENLHIFTLPVSTDSVSCSREGSGDGSQELLYSPYSVNVLVTRGSIQEPPLVFAHDADQESLFGSVSSESALPSCQAGFTFVRAGALHEANGGFLVVEASWVLRHFHLWELLKAAVLCRELRGMSTDPRCCMFASGNIAPEAIPLHTTVVVTGSSSGYSILSLADPDFLHLAGKPITACASGREEKSQETHPRKAGEIPSGKPLDISARKAIISLFSDPGMYQDSTESHFSKVLAVIGRARDYSEAFTVTAEHISKAAWEMYPEFAYRAQTALPQRQKVKLAGPDLKPHGPKNPIETLKLYSGKVMTYGKQT
ncbi:MAG TPA: AAA family ATPase [Deltaproteobacteria bacterium]|nr:AAA family ATPase [Deltaproteobacteria bacterium]HQI00264.1 AAA family ATPase [Deltaproteobacteria bacterium]HQJ08576.1 AAA family ATPase [Deltaproteobacteria bacterium]